MASNSELWKRKEAAVPRGVGVMCRFFADKAKNAEVWDVEGRRYIDFAGGIGVLNSGHLNPLVQAAVEAQLKKFTHTCFSIIPHELYVRAAERINRLAPGPSPKKTAFFSTGAEAVENAVKVARYHTGRPGIVAFAAGFHGRTNLTMALTGKVAPYKFGFGPFPGDVYHVPYPNELHGVSVQNSLDALDSLFKTAIEPGRVGAVIIEIVQGEGGFNVAPREFVHALRKICDEHGIVYVHDEVQSGFARTGKVFATEYYDVEPDIITIAKSMANGYPMSGVVGKASIMDSPKAGGLGGTYAGSPVGLAAVNAVLDIMEEGGILERSVALGDRFRARMEALRKTVPHIAQVRGLGSMVAVEFMKPGTREAAAEYTQKAQEIALSKGLLILTCGTGYNVIRNLYPITIEDAVFDEALEILEAALKEAM
ncbi:MAG: 4-aminobutyrate--2-oxoglutarate transaminase [Candidatus Accumulibacter sp.]|jgi:4-aminobutyrate aminotransferase|nr:4-aminobutyrate--2-oxoglutarate transaminase [Accumulibacter sp.]